MPASPEYNGTEWAQLPCRVKFFFGARANFFFSTGFNTVWWWCLFTMYQCGLSTS